MDPNDEIKSIRYESERSDLKQELCGIRGDHDFRWLRTVTHTNLPNNVDTHQVSTTFTDIFFCTKCLTKREIPA